MFKIKVDVSKEDGVIQMKDLEPCEISKIVEYTNGYYGEIVMRTADTKGFEVMSLSKPGKNRCWTCPVHILVKRLKEGAEVTLVVV